MMDYIRIATDTVLVSLLVSLAIGVIWEAVKPIVAYFRETKRRVK